MKMNQSQEKQDGEKLCYQNNCAYERNARGGVRSILCKL